MNDDFINHYSAQSLGNEASVMGTISKTPEFLAATLTDIGTTLWNSVIDLPSFLLPKSLELDSEDYRVDTYDVLNRLNSNWGNYFVENQDLVQAVSFVGGVLLPGGGALKGMKLLRSGKTSLYPEALSAATRQQDVKTLSTLMADGEKATQEFKNLRRSIFLKGATNEFVDSAAMEAAVVGSMSTHPFMEDYMKDPWSNFALWTSVGGVLGTGLSFISQNHEIRSALGTLEKESLNTLNAARVDLIPGLPAADTAQRFFLNADNYKQMAERTDLNKLTTDAAASLEILWRGKGQKLLLDSISDDIKAAKGLDKELQKSLLEQTQGLLKRNESLGIDSVRFLGETKASFEEIFRKTPEFTKQLPIQDEKYIAALKELGDVRRTTISSARLSKYVPDYKELFSKAAGDYVAFSPVFKAFIPKQSVWMVQQAADLGKKGFDSIAISGSELAAHLNFGYLERAPGNLPGVAQGRFIDALGSVFSVRNINRTPHVVEIRADDLALMNAWLSRQDELVEGGRRISFAIKDLKGEVTNVPLADLSAVLARKKEEAILELSKQGASLQEIATRVDAAQNAVEAFLIDRLPINQLPEWRKIVDWAKIDSEYLSPLNRTLQLNVNPSKRAGLAYRNADMQINLDQKALDNFNSQVIETSVLNGGSEIARAFFIQLQKNKELFSMLKHRLGEVNNELVGSFAFSSADHALRRLGDTGTLIAQISKDLYGGMNRIVEQRLTNLSVMTKRIADNQVFLDEFNASVNTLQGVSGYRYLDEETATMMVRRQSIDPITKERIAGQFEVSAVLKADGAPLVIQYEPVKAYLREMQKIGGEMRSYSNTLRSIEGGSALNDIGLWIPAFNPVNKFISYIKDATAAEGEQIKLLVGKDARELAQKEADWKRSIGSSNPQLELITKGKQESYNFIQNRLDPVQMDYANIALRHSGASEQAIVPVGTELIGTIIENLHGRLLHYTRKLHQSYHADIFASLDQMSSLNQQFTRDQPLRGIAKLTNASEDAALSVRNILLGQNNLSQYGTWQSANNTAKMVLEMTAKGVSNVFQKNVDFDNLGVMKKRDFVKLEKDLKDAGAVNPFSGYDAYLSAKTSGKGGAALEQTESLYASYLKGKAAGKPSTAENLVAAANGVMATLALRLMDIAHPLVNAMSMPILMNGNLMGNLPKTFLGIDATAAARSGGMTFAARAMHDGVRARFNPALAFVVKEFENEGYIKPIVSEASEIIRLIHSGDKNAAASINKILDSGLVRTLAKPADKVEIETRAIALMTGYQAAARAYPGLGHEGKKLFAKQFMDRVIGNYYSFQRPAMFQGTLGTAIGLFQTYMLSMGQSMYRNIEEGAHKALAGTMLTQAGMFGFASLPFYDTVSKAIGANMSDKHYDLTTGIYRAIGDPLAEFVLYGLPSNIGTLVGSALGIEELTKAKGAALYTRGELQPRLPFLTANPLEQLVAVNAAKQAYTTGAHIIDKIQGTAGIGGIAQALAEGLSMQSISRPVARATEIATGYSVTQEGNTVMTPEDIWTMSGVGARILSSRTTEEQIRRHANHLNSFYGSLDHDARKEATESVKQAIRSGDLSPEQLEKAAAKYMRTGTSQGWQSAVTEAIVGTTGGLDYRLSKLLRPDSPLNLMVNDL